MSNQEEIKKIEDDATWAHAQSVFLGNLARNFTDSDHADPKKTSLHTRISDVRLNLQDYIGGNGTLQRKQLEDEIEKLITDYNRTMKPASPPPAPTSPTKNQKAPTSPTTPPAPSDDKSQSGKKDDPTSNDSAPAGFIPLKKRVDTGFGHLGLDKDGNPTPGGWYDKVNNLGMTVVGEDGKSGLVGRVEALENAPVANNEAVKELDDRVTAIEKGSFSKTAFAAGWAIALLFMILVGAFGPFSWSTFWFMVFIGIVGGAVLGFALGFAAPKLSKKDEGDQR